MFNLIPGVSSTKLVMVLGVIAAFFLTYFATKIGMKSLPRDAGRAFAINGSKSVGKPRGAGIIFILTFSLVSIIFLPLSIESSIYIVLVILAMFSGYFDDASSKPWGNLKKGLIDFVIALASAVTYLYYNGNTFKIAFTDTDVTLNYIVYGILIVILVWVSINVTNCSDGVDGLCSSLSIITLASIYAFFKGFDIDPDFRHMIIFMVVAILAYLWFNASPSMILMGDAGSRAIGIFIALAVLKLERPLLFIPLAIMLIIDGGLGLLELSVRRVLRVKNFMDKVRTPIHDHWRKNLGVGDNQVVIRFTIIQTVIGLAAMYFI
jgi:phospho-N-acetylmuramoyl-pentapeptide-transferase